MFRTECKKSEIGVAIPQACPLPDHRRRVSLTATDAARQNRLLGALSHGDFERLRPHLRQVSLTSGEVLHEPRRPLRHTYFPTTSIVSKSYGFLNGASAEIAIVGNEGLVGVAVIMGVGSLLSRAVVQSSGFAYQLKAERLREEVARSGAMQRLLLRYVQSLITQMAQAAVCNRHHRVDQQLCRWLLLSLDRSPSPEIALTQELIAKSHGVRRESITDAAGKLQHAGLIHYRRGRISVLNRSGLEARTCECYAVVKKECDRLLPPPMGL